MDFLQEEFESEDQERRFREDLSLLQSSPAAATPEEPEMVSRLEETARSSMEILKKAVASTGVAEELVSSRPANEVSLASQLFGPDPARSWRREWECSEGPVVMRNFIRD